MANGMREFKKDAESFNLGELPPILQERVRDTLSAVADHSRAVLDFSLKLADELGLPESKRETVAWAALLHDTGKVKVPGDLLFKVGRPTEEELRIYMSHVDVAQELEGVVPPEVVKAIVHHGDRWDGVGSPMGKSGPAIPLAARVIAVADVYASARYPDFKPSTTGLTPDPREILSRLRGTKLDPSIVDAALKMIEADGAPGPEGKR